MLATTRMFTAQQREADSVLPLCLSSSVRSGFAAVPLLFVGDYKRQIFLRCWKACIIKALP